MSKRNVHLIQVNHSFGEMAFLPYSVGMLQAYCHRQDDIRDAFDFQPFVFLREDVRSVVRRMERPDVVGLSSYIWNWEYNRALAQAIRTAHPECLIVMGGPQVPVDSEEFFRENPMVDIAVHHEGEYAFADILRARADGREDYAAVPGLSVRSEDGTVVKTPDRERILDLDELPSPYLDGVFDTLMEQPYRWSASHETNRGCPYSCAFCDWGSAVFTKLRQFSTERLTEELEWFGRKGIDIIYNCDANHGILARDLELAEKLASVRRKYKSPAQFRTAYAKKSNDTVYAIAKTLHDAGLERGVTLSMQSMSDSTLSAIKRRNIKQDNLGALIRRYREGGIPTYTELILGLPGESADSFRDGVGKLLELGQHEALLIYLCEVLPNSELGNAYYRRVHGVHTVRMPLLLAYVTPDEGDVTENFEVVVETATLSRTEWESCLAFSWFVQSFHCLNLTQAIALFLHAHRGLAYRDFYEELIQFAASGNSEVLGRVLHEARTIAESGLGGSTMGRVVPDFGNITWNPEEAIFLDLVRDKEGFYSEIAAFLTELDATRELGLSDRLRADLVAFQRASLVGPGEAADSVVCLGHRLPDFLSEAYLGESPELAHAKQVVVLTSGRAFADQELYALEAVRYGRKNNGLRRTVAATTP
ncbi:B12-binding domain-containing radical SAM protein [Streptomyces sp. NPDC060006]|uniref:B12-binding domain-containing radical SAM protein n=1 Tax=unclassified Streptomyces TaxID=2593676 RepID=UPI003699CCAF